MTVQVQPHIETKRLVLEGLAPGDAESLFAYRSLPDVTKWQTWQPTCADDAVDFIARVGNVEFDTPGTWFQLGIRSRESGALLGDIGVHFLEDGEQVALGYTLDPQHQGNGLATEAVEGLIGFLFGRLGKHRVEASADPRNEPSLRLLRRIGMRQEAHFVSAMRIREQWVDDVTFGLLKTEWEALHPAI